MKKICVAMFLLAFTLCARGQWMETNLTGFNYLAVTGVASHNQNLYSIVFNGFSADLYLLNADEKSWTKQAISGVNEIPQRLVSAGSQLYMTTVGLGYGMLYRSDDNGAVFEVDTAGLPKFFNGIVPPVGIQIMDGKVVVNLGASGYWTREASGETWQHIDPATSLNGGVDPICFVNGSLFAHDNSGANLLYVSGDFGQTWEARSTNLPEFFIGHLLEANAITGRLYLAGGKSDGSAYGIYYSDDDGFTWTAAPLAHLITTNAQGGQQEVTALYASGTDVYVALENNSAQSTPDVLSTSSGIENLAYDTLGLLTDPAGSMQAMQILPHKNKMVLALNVRDVYLKNAGNATPVHETSFKSRVLVYPNPVSNVLYVETEQEISAVQVMDLQGRMLRTSSTKNIDVTGLTNGVYLLKVRNADHQVFAVHRFLKQ